jgi:hypothetical protein
MSSSEATALSAATRAYADRARAAGRAGPPDPFGPDAPTATDVAVTASAMLSAVGIEPFELGLWRAWGSPHGEGDFHGDP